MSNSKTVTENGYPASAFRIDGVFLTNLQAYALRGLADSVALGLIDLTPAQPFMDSNEFKSLTASLDALQDALLKAGWKSPA